jgi:glycosyltransferase involved in cell wall biosynthesis
LLGSALGQTYKNIKVLVVDDGSTDRTFDVVSDFQDAVSVIRHSINKGQSSARNTGILSCDGEYILFLDSDDYLEPDAIETLWTQLEPLTGKDEKWAVSYGKRLTCDSDLNPIWQKGQFYKKSADSEKTWPKEKIYFWCFL